MGLIRRLLSFVSTPRETLADRVLHGGFWASLSNVGDRLLQLAKTALLARLLVPADFGIYGIALLCVSALRRFSNTGFDAALIHHERENVDSYLDTTWVVNVLRGCVLFGVLFVSAPFIAAFFDQPRAEAVVRVVGCVAVINGLANPAVVYFRKDLEFHKQFAYRFSASLVGATIAVGVALRFRSVWALVAGLVAASATKTSVSYLISDYRPRPSFDIADARELFGFGKWILALETVVWLATEADDAFVGWYLGAAALGLYQLAFRFSNAPATEITHVISSVTFPAYAKLQNDAARLQRAFANTIRVTFLLAVPVSVGTVLVGPAFVAVVLGAKWLPMIPALQVMVLAGFARAVSATGGALFRGVGAPEWDFRMNALRTAVIAITIWPLTDRFEIAGAGASIVLGIVATLPVWLYKTRAITGVDLRTYAECFGVPLAGAAVMAVPVFRIVDPTPLRLGLAVGCGVLVYPLVVEGIYRLRGKSALDVLSNPD